MKTKLVRLNSLFIFLSFFSFSGRAQTYCIPAFVNGCSGIYQWHNDTILLNTLNWIVDTSDCSLYDYTSMGTTLTAGITYPMQVNNGIYSGCSVWIDLNNDGVFDSSENFYHGYTAYSGYASYSFAITIPLGTPIGAHRMRVLSAWSSDGFSPESNGYGPCGSADTPYQFGNFDDFTINVINDSCTSAPAAFTAYSTTVCLGTSGVIYTVPADTAATSYTWAYSGTGATFTSTTNSVSISFDSVATGGTLSVIANVACGSSLPRTLAITVSRPPSAGAITGEDSVYAGGTITLTDTTGAGIWSESYPSVATIGASSGLLTAIAAGSDIISYAVTNSCGTAIATKNITVSTLDGISGYVYFGSVPYYGNITVWLITYDSSTFNLEAIDSEIVTGSGSSSYYQFTGISTGSFRIKAAMSGVLTYSTTGYVPTYHTSSFYWDTATVLSHITGTADTGQDINMAYGSVAAGPGFIGGNVTTGADRGTATAIPAVGLLMLLESATGNLIQQTYTDISGNYSFSGLPLGNYRVYPEAINYTTTPYTGISLTATNDSMFVADFIEHLLSQSITPVTTAAGNTIPVAASLFTYPNPSTGQLYIKWNETATEKAAVIITNIAGQEVYKSTINMSQGSGNSTIDLSAITDGLYVITIRSGNINYTSKVQVLR